MQNEIQYYKITKLQ